MKLFTTLGGLHYLQITSLEPVILFNGKAHTWLDCYHSGLEFIFPHFRQTYAVPQRHMGELYQRCICVSQRGRSFHEAQLLVKLPSRYVVSCCTILSEWRSTGAMIFHSQCRKMGRKKKNCSLPSRLDNTLGTCAVSTCLGPQDRPEELNHM